MRKIREVLWFKYATGLDERPIAQSLSVARSTVQECLRHARAAGIRWPFPDELTDAQLDTLLYLPAVPVADIPLPDCAHVDRELSRPGVTRYLLWHPIRSTLEQGTEDI